MILGTANIRLQFGTFVSYPLRAICDTGAQAGLITVAQATANAFPIKQCNRSLNGIGGQSMLTRKIQAHILPWFVSNRVKEIQENTKGAIWAHVSTSKNPADLLSRGMKAEDFLASKLWKGGPELLLKPQAEWPKSKLIITPEIQAKIDAEMKPK